MSATISIRLPDELAQQLTMLAEATRRSKSFCAAEAVRRYVEEEAWQLQAIEDGLQDARNGRVTNHGEVADWVASWDTPQEKRPPKCK